MGPQGGLSIGEYGNIKESAEMSGTPWGHPGGFNIRNMGGLHMGKYGSIKESSEMSQYLCFH